MIIWHKNSFWASIVSIAGSICTMLGIYGLAEGEIAKQIGGEYPCLLLDDVFSELDETRRKYILSKIKGRQIIVTSCEPDVIPVNDADGEVTFRHVENGVVSAS